MTSGVGKMRILITGALGFIGSAVATKIAQKYGSENVVIFDNVSYSGFYSHVKHENITIFEGDLKNKKDIEICFKKHGAFDIVIHMAAESAVDKSIKIYDEFILTNILGSANLFSVCLKENISKIISINTDEIFGQLQPGEESFNENSPVKPRNIYSASKASQYLFSNAFKETYGLPVVNVCPSNCYGPRQLPEKLLPRMIYLLDKGMELPVYGTGKNIREWLFVEDAAAGIEFLIENGEIGENYTIGSGNEKTNLEILTLLASIMNKEPKFKFIEDRKGHDFRYSVNFEKIKNLGWEPAHDLEAGLFKTISWYKQNYNWLETEYKKVWG